MSRSTLPGGLLGGAALASALVTALLPAAPAQAVVTSTWTVETYPQLDAGDATAALITSLGEVRPGWETKRVALEGDAAWAAVRLADGQVLIGSDAGGAIYRVDGAGARPLVAIPGAIAVVALVQAADGQVFAGAMPGNKLYRIDVAAGKATAVATLKDAETIWSLAAAGDTVYAGTGPQGKLYAVTAKTGAAREVFASGDKRITALATTSDGAVWLGTSDRALVFRHDPKTGATRAMADFAGNEIGALAPWRDGVIAAAGDLADAPPGGPKSAAAVEAAEKPAAAKGQAAKLPEPGSKPGADKDPPSVTDLGRKGARKGKGALFRIGGDGRLEQLHALTQTWFTSLAVAPDGAIYAGAADKGRVYLIDPDGAVATAFDVEERAVSQLWWEQGRLAFATDDGAALYRATGRAAAARYVSDVFDAKAVARFGRLAAATAGKVTLETRSGNTAKPGVGWSEWAPLGAAAGTGGGVQAGKIASPPGRYLQFRAALGDDAARVRRVVAYYQPQNQPTTVEEVAVEPASKESLPTLKDGAAKPRSPVLKLRWKVENPDGDDTTYALEARRDGEAGWRPIATGKAPLAATSWEWSTETYPDGWYRVRVTASDAGANSVDRALTSSATTPLFSVDNTRPTIDGLAVSYPRATARAADAQTVLAEAAFSVDDGPWQLAASDDGLFDDLAEGLRLDLPAGLARGPHTLAVRVADAAGNLAAAATTFVVK